MECNRRGVKVDQNTWDSTFTILCLF